MKTLKKNTMKKQILSLVAIVVGLFGFTATAYAQADDLVNTESFLTIGDGDGTTDVELRFGNSLNGILLYDPSLGTEHFEFMDDLYINGTLETTGDATIGGNIITSGTVDGVDVSDLDATVTTNTGNIATNTGDIATNTGDIATNTGDIATNAGDIATNTGDIATNTADIATNAGDIATLQGQAHDQNTDTGSTTNTFVLDNDGTGGDVTLQFGTAVGEVIQWDNTNSRFNISTDLYVDGALELNGNLDFNQNQAVEMVIDQGGSFPGSAVEGQTFYRTDLYTFYIYANGSWTALDAAAGANSIFLSPLYPHATYFEDTTNNVGRLTYYFDDTNIENAYRWETTRPTDQDYDVKVRVQVPDDFAGWDSDHPIEFKYRTDTTATADNQIDFTMQDTAKAAVSLTNNTGLASTGVGGTWMDPQDPNDITVTGGTWTPGEWFTITIKLTADNGGGAEAGSIVLNYDTN